MAEEHTGDYTDVESLLKTSATRIVEQLKPKLEAGGKVRSILEHKANDFQDKAKQFVLGELNGTASALLRAIESEEAPILLGFNQAVEASFPPVPVLLAGCLSPSLLAASRWSHVLQLCFLFLPIFLSSAYAVYEDFGQVCGIPTMIPWIYTAFFLSLILTMGHLMLAMQLSSGKAALKAKSEEISARLAHNAADGETDFSDMQEIFIGGSVLVQQALLTEDTIRRSFWYHAIGAGTALWLIACLWNAIIVIGWTFVPGTIAFHEKAHSVAGGAFCGAWASVFTARVVCILMPLFFFLNVLQVIDWIVKSLINSSSFGKTMLSIAEQADAGMMGLPVVQMLVKAFVLRGSTDTAASKLTVALAEKVRLQREHAEVCAELEAIERNIKMNKKTTRALKKKADALGGTGLDAMITQLKQVEALDGEAWRDEGVKLVDKAMLEATAAKAAATEELDKIAQWIMEIVEQIQKSDTVQNAMVQARDAADQAQVAARDAAAQAQVAAQGAQRKAQEMAQQLPDAQVMNSALAQAQQAAGSGLQQAQAAAQQGLAQSQEAGQAAQQQAQQTRSWFG